jgi:hypothetical protein
MRFASGRLNYTTPPCKIDYRRFLPPKTRVLLDEKNEGIYEQTEKEKSG